nr:hypothetical protein [Bradyrhizobium sp. Ec3.3]
MLIRDITVVKSAEPQLLHLQIRWQGGATETIDVRRQPNRAEAICYPDTFVAKIRAMAEKYDDKEIIARLRGEALTSSTGKPFTVSIIRWIRCKHHVPSPSRPARRLTVSQVRERYGVSVWVVHCWIERGVVSAAQRKPNMPYAITIDDAADRRLREWVAHLHPQSPTQAHEVCYARCIGTPKVLSPPIFFGMETASHRRWKVRPRRHPITDLVEIPCKVFLEHLEGLSVHCSRSAIGFDRLVRFAHSPLLNRERLVYRAVRSHPVSSWSKSTTT